MSKKAEIYQAMRDSEMLAWVGGGDPEDQGKRSLKAVQANVGFREDMKILDFGCGIGRHSAAFVDRLGSEGELIGVDVVPDMVDFCNREIGARYGNSRFFCTESGHDFYSKFDRNPEAEGRMKEDDFFDRHESYFDLVLAFSIFTHFLEEDTRRYFSRIRRVLKPDGVFWFTCFLIDDVSVYTLENGLWGPGFEQIPKVGDDVATGSEKDPLAWVGYSQAKIVDALWDSDLRLDRVIYGGWRGYPAEGGQDQLAARPAVKIPGDFDPEGYLDLNPDLKEAGADPRKHFVSHGYVDGRRYRR